MSNRFTGRVDRFAQMSKQEELIARKRQEILDKQRTAQLAKAVQALQATNFTAKQKEIDDYRDDQVAIACGVGEEMNENNKEVDDNKNPSADELSADISATAVVSQTKKNNLCSRTGKIPVAVKRVQSQASAVEQPVTKIMNSFCNDGSFLENFKKILEKADQPKPLLLPANLAKMTGIPVEENPTENVDEIAAETTNDNESQLQSQLHQQQQQQQQQHAEILDSIAFNPVCFLNQQHPVHLMQHLPMTLTQPPPPPPPPTSSSHDATRHVADFFPSITTSSSSVMNVSMAPPISIVPIEITQYTTPPPPLYMIPPPEPLQVNTIPAPKEFNLNAIPKPQINLDAIQIPQIPIEHQYQQQQQQKEQQQLELELQQQHQQQQQPQPQQIEDPQVLSDNNDCEQNPLTDLPSSVEMLIASVAVNGDEYEDKLCHMHKSNIHPTMWFIFNKSSPQYCSYRQRVNEFRQHHHRQQQQPPQQQLHNEQQQQQQSIQQRKVITCDSDKYDPETAISGDVDSDDEYMRGMMDRNRDNLKRRIECRNELSEEERQESAAQEAEGQQRREERKRQRKSRWGEKVPDDEASSSSVIATVQTSFANQNKPMLKAITRTDPALLNYARTNYGTVDLSEEDWQKCEEHFKVNILYQDMIAKRQEIDRLARSGKFKFEYDSDEDVEGGTWEHKLRCAEMDATQLWASALTKQSEGKHHIGDFLPPEELKKFMEQYEAKKNNRMPDLSDYKEYKLKEDNIGFQMLQKLGWKEGQGLGQDGAGIVDPVNKCAQREGNQGLGVGSAATPATNDNEYDAYRKRMMLAYRFRPNPMNNPRRAYY